MHILPPSRRSFTLIEMLIVTAIVSMLFMAVLPKISSIPKRLIVEKACSDIQRAFNETALQARTSGKAKTLTLRTGDDAAFSVSENTQNLSHGWMPPERPPAQEGTEPDNDDGVSRKSPFWSGKNSYPLSSEITWNTEDINYDEETGIQFTFFADGQAAGPDLQFTIKERSFSLKLNQVTAQLSLEEITD